MKIVIWDHSDHQIWTPYMWSMSLDRCSPVFSVRDKIFQKVTNWSALVPEINSEQRDLWPFWLLPVALIQCNEWSKISVYVVKVPQIVKKWHQIDDSSLLQKCQFCMLAMYKGQYHAENDCPTMKNRDLGPLGPSNLDPIYVIYVFGSMLSCILCERQKFQKVTNWSALVPEINSEQRDLWPFW